MTPPTLDMNDYFDNHTVLTLIGLALFPRITLLVANFATGGVLWWLGWIFAPHLLVAILASMRYWDTNPVLVIIAWLCALSGESAEKTYANNRNSHHPR